MNTTNSRLRYICIIFIILYSCSNIDNEYKKLIQQLDQNLKTLNSESIENNILIAEESIKDIKTFQQKYINSEYDDILTDSISKWKIYLNTEKDNLILFKKKLTI